MIKADVWISLSGAETPIRDLDTNHLNNAIAVVERNDSRYGVKHGAALPALYAERKRRAQAGDWSAALYEFNAGVTFWPRDYAVADARRVRVMFDALNHRLNALEAQIPDLIIVDELSKLPRKAKRRTKKGRKR